MYTYILRVYKLYKFIRYTNTLLELIFKINWVSLPHRGIKKKKKK